MTEKNTNNCGLVPARFFAGTFDDMERRLRYVEKMRSIGYHVAGVTVKCCKCENPVFLDSLRDYALWRNGKIICDSCRVAEHYNMDKQAREEVERKNREFFEKLAKCKNASDFDNLVLEIDQSENRFAPRVQKHFADIE